MQNKRSLFGTYRILIDETIHCILALIASFIGYLLGLSLFESLIIFLAGAFLIDIDHFFNSYICKKILKISDYKGNIRSGDRGYAPNILHGFDVAFILGGILGMIYGPLFGVTLFTSLSLHLLWDFAVYPSHPSFLLFITRASNRFNIGERKKFTGRIFDLNSLRY